MEPEGVRHLSYILVGRTPIEAEMEEANAFIGHSVAQTMVRNHQVSTIFLAFDHEYWDGLPILFETMVFYQPRKGGSRWDTYQRRWRTYDEAEAGHEWVVDRVRRNLTP